MVSVLVLLASMGLGLYAKNAGRSIVWAGVPFLLSAAITFFSEANGGPSSSISDLFSFAVTLLAYFFVGQMKIAADKAKSSESP
jgi:hypothetical protein